MRLRAALIRGLPLAFTLPSAAHADAGKEVFSTESQADSNQNGYAELTSQDELTTRLSRSAKTP